MPENTGQKTI